MSEKPVLFISHKHVDSAIADVLRNFINIYSGGRVEVFQSSSPVAASPKVGRSLTKELKKVLRDASVVILLYTDQDQDWTYCMWEMGVASHPDTPETRIILFQCSSSAPALFADQVNVNAKNVVDIQKFVDDFLTSKDFFPECDKAVTDFQSHGQEVASAAADLCQKLQPVLPVAIKNAIDWPAYPFLQIELSLEQVNLIQASKPEERLKVAQSIILKEGTIINADKYCEQLFGMPSFPPDIKLGDLIENWKSSVNADTNWVNALCSQITDGAMWKFPKPVLGIMQGVNDQNWYAPQLIRARKIDVRNCMQFDIYFLKIIPSLLKQILPAITAE
ncbi:MAG: toll/interleukin-1 receptor domain-containing protein [Chitinophagaceae bacterium]|nr:toll/interleukin-1 receptor domain-containing protein [Chitinophagaceae bacterium]